MTPSPLPAAVLAALLSAASLAGHAHDAPSPSTMPHSAPEPLPADSSPAVRISDAPEPVPSHRHREAPWSRSGASWYGPGFYGRRTACGQALTRALVGVAHRTLPCGTLVQFRHGGTVVTAPVVDRGPYIAGREWDMTAGLCSALGRCWTGRLEWRLVP